MPTMPWSPSNPSSAASSRAEAAVWFGRGVGAAAGALFVAMLATGFLAAGRAILLVFVAVLLGAALEPLVGRVRDRLPIPRGGAILVVYLVFFSIVVAFVALVVPGSIAQAGDLASGMPAALDRARSFAAGLQPGILSTSLVALVDTAQAAVASSGTPAPGDVVAAGLTVADGLVSVVTVLALVFFWMTERARLQRFALSFLPAERRAGVRNAWNDIEIRLGAWVRGQLILMGVIAVLTGATCFILGLPSALLLGVIAGLAELIPMVGPAIGAVPALLVAATVRPEVFFLVLIAYVVIHFVEGNILVPRIMGNAAGISPFLVITSLLVGGAIDGLRGALIAVPVAAAIEVILERLQDREEPVAPAAESIAVTGSNRDVADAQSLEPAI